MPRPKMNAQDTRALTATVTLESSCCCFPGPSVLWSVPPGPVKAQFRSSSLWGPPSPPTHPTSHPAQAWLQGCAVPGQLSLQPHSCSMMGKESSLQMHTLYVLSHLPPDTRRCPALLAAGHSGTREAPAGPSCGHRAPSSSHLGQLTALMKGE